MTLPQLRKLSLLLLTAGTFATAGYAQVKFGIRNGLNISEILTSDHQIAIISGSPRSIRNFPKTGYNGGIFLSVPLSAKFSLQPELIYSNQGATGKPSSGYTITATESYKLNFLNIPLLLQYKLPLGFFISTGPQLGLLLSAKINEDIVGVTNTNHYHVKDSYKSTDFSWVLGGGYVSPINLGFDIRYNLGLSNFSNTNSSKMSEAPVQDGSIKNSVVQMSIFYLFGRIKSRPPAIEGN